MKYSTALPNIDELTHTDEPLASLEYNLKAAIKCLENDDANFRTYLAVAVLAVGRVDIEKLGPS